MYHQHKWIETSPSKFVSFVISYHQVRQNNEQTVTNSTSSLVRYNTIHVHLYIVHGKVTALTNRKFSRTYVTTTLDLSTLTDFVKLAPQSEGVKLMYYQNDSEQCVWLEMNSSLLKTVRRVLPCDVKIFDEKDTPHLSLKEISWFSCTLYNTQ